MADNFKLDVDADGIALIVWNMPGRSMNVIDRAVIEELSALVEKVATDAAIKGAVIASGKDTFCAGADLTLLDSLMRTFTDMAKDKGEEAAVATLFAESRKLSQLYRRIETCGKPFVAAINGTALGGGFELCLACHQRIAADNAGDPAGASRGQDRPVPRRRRHPAPRPHDGDLRRAAIPAQGRPDRCRPRQDDEAGRRGGARRRSHQGRQGLGQGQSQGQGAVGRRWLPRAEWPGLFARRHDDVAGRQRHLPARDL